MSLKHRKKRNTALVYEFLVRRMASTMVDQDPDSYVAALQITRKYFKAGQPLAEERELFDAVVNSRGLSEQAAHRVLQDVQRHARNSDERLLEIKKSNLIKDVNYTFGQDFFDVHRVREYRLLASVQMLLDRYRRSNAPLNEDVEKIRLEEGLVKYMTTIEPAAIPQAPHQVDSLVARLAMKKFEERYSGSLNEAQKLTLRKFMNFTMTGDRDKFSNEMVQEKVLIEQELRDAQDLGVFAEDSVMHERLSEARCYLKDMKDLTTESAVQDILLYQNLLKEIGSND